ncbi:MAG: hypothetical protein EPN85_03545 [Bacteroidetes bacterium]|nr:MAG: hypothetical protein EPN85_03545 [Bacteroidota bacterium]
MKKYGKLTKDKTLFILDRSVIENWIEGGSNSEWTRAFIDLLAYLKRKWKGMTSYVALLPVDALIEIKKAGKKYVMHDTFKDVLNSLLLVIEANPHRELSSEEAVKIIATAHLDKNYTPIIITLNKENYSGIACHCLEPKDVFHLFIMFYGLMPEPAQKVYSTWFENLATA